MNRQKIDDLVCYYDQFYQEEFRPRRTSIGYYKPTNMHDARALFDILYDENFLDVHDILVDAGSGDGRIAALASLYGVSAIAIEGDARIHALATQRIRDLYAQKILPYDDRRLNLWTACGNFLHAETYVDHFHLHPQQVTLVFNTGDNERAIAQFMRTTMMQECFLIIMQSNGDAAARFLHHYKTHKDRHGKYIGSLHYVG